MAVVLRRGDPAAELDRALRSPTRWWPVAVGGFVCVFGAVLVVAGQVAPLGGGGERSGFVLTFGLELMVLGATGAVAVWPPQRQPAPLPPPRPVVGGLALPTRRTPLVAGLAGLMVLAVLGVTLVVLAPGYVKTFGAGMAFTAGFDVFFRVRAARRGNGLAPVLMLTPDAVTMPAGRTSRVTIAWGDISDVAIRSGFRQELLVADRGQDPARCWLAGQAWPPHVLLEVIEHYRDHPGARAELVDPRGLIRFT